MSRLWSIRGLVLSLLLCAPLAQAAREAPPSAASFFGDAAFSGAKLSPSGRYLAALTHAPGGRTALSVIDLGATKAQPTVIDHAEADIRRFTWISDDVLAYDLIDQQKAPGLRHNTPGLFSVRRDGSKGVQLASRSGTLKVPGESSKMIRRPWTTLIEPQGSPGAGTFYIAAPAKTIPHLVVGTLNDTDLLRVDAVNGGAVAVERPGQVQWWTLDASGEPRLAKVNEGASDALWLREPDGKWRKLREDLAFGSASDLVTPVGFGPDGTLYATARNGKDTTALYALDLASGKIQGPPLLEAKGYDIDAELVMDSRKLLGVRYRTDVAATAWFDDKMAALQTRVDELLPATINKLTPPRFGDAPWVLVESQSDVIPTTWLLYNRDTKALARLGSTHPAIRAEQMGRMRTVHYTARDGFDIEALLTLPPGAKDQKLPLVVLAHDGPWQRGPTWGWRDESQFLAARGYAVLEPAYRGSTGLGNKLFEAGRKQWGKAMQDDLADGARWALQQGVAEEGRICIAGKGYGGYATLMGLANDPELYQCGVAWGAMTDLPMHLAKGWNTLDEVPDHDKQYSFGPLIGDPVRDADALKEASPLTQAARIKAPLLLAHGEADGKVAVEHGRKFYDAVKRDNQQVEWVEYPSEWNTWELVATRIDFWNKAAAFLDRQIGRTGHVNIIY
jgi:dipeptidyl aminopeptidase/acylaminoacyl peptidase